jgi:hypothetical protein
LAVEVGMSLRDCLEQLREHVADSPVQVVVDETRPYEVDVGLELPQQGLRLRFHALHQRLVVVDVFDPTKLTLVAGDSGQPFTGAAGPPSFQAAYALFGPTYPGRLEDDGGSSGGSRNSPAGGKVFMLQFPGVAFEFPVPSHLEPAFTQPGLAFRPPPGSPGAQRLYFFYGHDVRLPQLPPLDVGAGGHGLRYMEPCHVCFYVSGSSSSGSSSSSSSSSSSCSSSSSNNNSNSNSNSSSNAPSEALVAGAPTVLRFPARGDVGACALVLGASTPQAVLSLLGPPATVFHHHDPHVYAAAAATDKAVAATSASAGLGLLAAVLGGNGGGGGVPGLGGGLGGGHRNGMDTNPDGLLGDYVFGYPDAGLDVQFHGSLHVARKVHVTANLPGRPDFMQYDRCHFTLVGLPNHPPWQLGSLLSQGLQGPGAPGPSPVAPNPAAATAVGAPPALLLPAAAMVTSVADVVATAVPPPSPKEGSAAAATSAEPEARNSPAGGAVVVSGKKKKKKGKGEDAAAAVEAQAAAASKAAPAAKAAAAAKAAVEAKAAAEAEAAADAVEAAAARVASEAAAVAAAVAAAAGAPSNEAAATVATPWAELEARLFGLGAAAAEATPTGSGAPVPPRSRPSAVAVHTGDGQHPFGPTLLYCAEPHARVLVEVSRGGFVCALTLY